MKTLLLVFSALTFVAAARAAVPPSPTYQDLTVLGDLNVHGRITPGPVVTNTLPAVGAAQANQAAGIPAGDCEVDDTLGVNTFFAAHPNSTIIVPTACYRIVSGDLVLPFNVELVGTGNSQYWMRRYDAWQHTSTFMFDGAHSFVPFMAHYVRNIAVVRDGAQTPCPAGAKFTGFISGNTLTVTNMIPGPSGIPGTIHLTDLLGGPGIPSPRVTVDSNGSGTGGTGTYTISESLSLDSQTMTTGPVPTTPMCGDPTDGQMQALQAGWGTETSTGMYLAPGTPLQLQNQRSTGLGFSLDHIFIGGFFKPLDLETGIGTVRDVYIDGYNGAYFGPNGANTLMENIQVNRWFCSASANCLGGKSEFRGGIGFYFDQAAIHLHESFAHNYTQGLVVANVKGGFFHNVAAEFQNYDSDAHLGTTGIRTFGSTNTRFGGEMSNFLAFVQPYQFEASDVGPNPHNIVYDMPHFIMQTNVLDENDDSLTLNPNVMSYVYLGGRTTYANTLTFGGAPIVGSTISAGVTVTVPAATSATTPFGPVTANTTAITNPALKSGNVLTFGAIPVGAVPGMAVTDTTQPTAYPAGTIIIATTATTLTTSAKPILTVGSGDTISVSLDNTTLALAPTAAGVMTPAGVMIGATVTDSTTGGVIPPGTKVLAKTLYNVTLDKAITGGGVVAADAIAFTRTRNFSWTATNQDIAYNPNNALRLAAMARQLGYKINIDPVMAVQRCHAESVRKPNSLNIYCPVADTVTIVPASSGGVTSTYNYDTRTSGATAAGQLVLNFTGPIDTGISVGDMVLDVTTPSAITAGTKVASVTTTSVTLDTVVAGGGVGNGDHIQFPGAPEGGTAALLYNAQVSNNRTAIPILFQDGGASAGVTFHGLSADTGFWDRWTLGATAASNINIHDRLLMFPPTVTGTGCTLVTGTDEKGTVAEGTSSTGCTITFRSDFPWTPAVEIIGPDVSDVTVAADNGSVTWTTPNPGSTTNYRYRVDFK